MDESGSDVSIHHQGDVLRVVLDRPAHRNSLDHAMVDTLVAAFTAAATDDSLRAIHLTGAGGDFCSGADWVSTNAAAGNRPRTGHLVRGTAHRAHRLIELVQGIQLPVVCSVRGWAVGLGCNLALAADFTIAAEDAVFWEPFVQRGFTPDSGSTWLVSRLAGVARAKEMIMLGSKVAGARAAQWGLIHRAVAPAELDAAAEQLIGQLAAGPTVAIGLAKSSIHAAQTSSLAAALERETFDLEMSCRTLDFKEGLGAFKDRRDPIFTGR